MFKRNNLVFLSVLVLFVLAALVVFPTDKGTLFQKDVRLGLDLQGGTRIVYQADLTGVPANQQAEAIDGAISVLENRINPLGVSETTVRKLGEDQILVEVPGRALTDAEKQSLGAVALLEFGEQVTGNETPKWVNIYGNWIPAAGTLNGVSTELTSRFFKTNTYVDRNQTTGAILLRFEWDADGATLSKEITTRLLHKQLGIFEANTSLLGDDNKPIAPTVNDVITNQGVIEGLSLTEATRLSKQLNAGRLPVPLSRTGDEKTVEPWLGGDFVSKAVKAGLVGVSALMLFMIIYYRVSGVVASLALIYYGVLTLAIFKLFNFTLTLSGIGGFILSIGMAIDANVLIFERMKEEMWDGKTLGSALEAGFRRAWTAILDSNVTTILAGAILLWLGSSNVIASDVAKGFAVTLILGVLVSMFTAITVTRTFLRPFIGTDMGKNISLFAPYQRKKNV
jgi:preprotein translocase subunit SecD